LNASFREAKSHHVTKKQNAFGERDPGDHGKEKKKSLAYDSHAVD